MIDLIVYFTATIAIMLIIMMTYFKDFYQRLICMGVFSNVTMVLIVALGSYKYNQSLIDIAIIYLLLSYVVNMAVLRMSSI
jgi:multisubunit Na+/H+ antiporter MnhF subunit